MPSPAPEAKIGALKERLRDALPRLREQYAVKRLAVHGSRCRGDAGPSSDLDILVDFEETEAGRRISLFDFIALQHDLEDLLGVPVDLGEAKALRGPAAEHIRREAEYV
jgi:hypothetical protein